MASKERLKLRKFIRELEKIRGRHTELVSVYVPADYELQKIINHLGEEQGTAGNIKDARTRNNVVASLDKVVRHLRLYKRTPENGLAVFAGNASTQENKIDIQVWSIEPPQPLNIRMYRCDQTFVLDPLKEMLESKEVYGLIVVDKREATIGLLKGTQIEIIANLTSGVPGKFKAGGQCLTPDTLVQLSDGNIVQIKDIHTSLKAIDFKNYTIQDTTTIDKWKVKQQVQYKIITKSPRNEITCSKDHVFFVRDGTIRQKPAEDLKVGDLLLTPEIIPVDNEKQRIIKEGFYGTKKPLSKVRLPNYLTEELAQLVGYYIGDGNIDDSRICFSEGRMNLAKYYLNFGMSYFNARGHLRFRKNKNYYEVRIYGRPMERLFRKYFPKNIGIPEIILKSPNKVLAAFLKGFFDAEGYVASRVALGINDKLLAKQVQLGLLRFGIISSLEEYDSRRNPYSKKHRHTVEIVGKDSTKRFSKLIGFRAKDKQDKLKELILKKSDKEYTRQILVPGSEIRRMIEKYGLKNICIGQFKSGSFFTDKRELSKFFFKKNIVSKIKNKELKKELNKILTYQVIPAKIKKIEIINKPAVMYDISTKAENFIANGLVVHNSAARFSRLREEAAKEFYNRINEICKQTFIGHKEIKGIIIGGPGPTKEEFLDYLAEEVKRKVKAMKDITYTDEHGLHDLVDISKDILAKEIVTKEKELMQRFFTLLNTNPGRVAYGREEVDKAIEQGAVEILLLSESMEDDILSDYEVKGEEIGSQVEIVSIETGEGVQLKEMGKIAAILRFNIK